MACKAFPPELVGGRVARPTLHLRKPRPREVKGPPQDPPGPRAPEYLERETVTLIFRAGGFRSHSLAARLLQGAPVETWLCP